MLSKFRVVTGFLILVGLFLAPTVHSETDLASLPAGPIRDRVELMEEIGAAAKKINEAAKAGDTQAVIAPAEEIARLTPKFAELFPAGSTHPNSRAKASIWTNPDEFEAYNDYMAKYALAIAATAKDGGNVKKAVKKMFKSCKSCHKKYRIPDED
ncbi:MAG: cytochrome c [Candidatus Binatia bacterium]|nr:cytochrome c [Candidatus Binatia bacterium]MDG1959712.1 cytochrome c [Candidatus Binatia bacterium]MDG2010227.1 cytochrome c [Candidatus Binatia bacterium]